MNYCLLRKNDIANGEGVRVTLFVSGCPHHCKGCFNQEAWDYSYGKEFNKDILKEIIEALERPHISGITFLGGEPLCPENQEEVLHIIECIKDKFLDSRNIWIYTGYSYEDFYTKEFYNETIRKIFLLSDILVDGKFIEEEKNISLVFRGSSNQRIIDLKETRNVNKLIILPDSKFK